MLSSKSNNKARSIGNFAALKTAIAIGDVAQIKDLLPKEPMVEMEKDYLIELAELNSKPEVLTILKDIPVKR